MSDRVVDMGGGFWNIRGTWRIKGLINAGTQSSLVRLESGRFVLLDSYTLHGAIEREVLELTDGGAAIEAVLNLHPFHTLHVERVAARFPGARHYGTARHHRLLPDLGWQPERTETEAFAALFADDFDFSVPAGVDFIARDERLHFASVLAFHRRSRVLHVDDTLNYLPFPLGRRLDFHPTLPQVLERRPGAAAEFRGWAEGLIERCAEVDHVCTAHAGLAKQGSLGSVADQVRAALKRAEATLAKHEAKHGAG